MKKSLALMQHLELPYFQVDGVYFQGEESEAKESYNNSFLANMEFSNFPEWCFENCLLVEPEYTDIDNDYLVCDDDEAFELASEYIKESLWAFNASFIIDHSKLPYDAAEMLQSLQEQKCEGANDVIEALIEDLGEFIIDAISADGRGHFLSSYDGEENEVNIGDEYFYVYRIN